MVEVLKGTREAADRDHFDHFPLMLGVSSTLRACPVAGLLATNYPFEPKNTGNWAPRCEIRAVPCREDFAKKDNLKWSKCSRERAKQRTAITLTTSD